MADNSRVRLAQMVENTGMLRREVAKYLGIHQRTLYRYLSGELEIPVMVMLAMELMAKRK